MTERELYNYKMIPAERAVWADFCRIIRDKCTLMDTPPMDKILMERHLLIEEPYHFARGYSKEEGYYDILEGDRGELFVKIRSHSLDDVVSQKLCMIAHDMSFQYVIHNRKDIDAVHRTRWHFYEEDGPVENGRIVTTIVENDKWEYDTMYDYRKYWFELSLTFLAKVLTPERLAQEIERYEDLMNRHFEGKFWSYDMQKLEFTVVDKISY
ncbi:MAG: hypothetical protein J1E64_11470 [Acetatifactor sp.]|nr:hypothetical protein [Acetatifactor sp.]